MLVPATAFGAGVLIGDKITIEEDEVIEGDYYVSVGTLGTTVMSGRVTGDMYALAGKVTANGIIEGDFGSVGGSAMMNASVTDDVRIVAGEVEIDDYVGGDLLVIAGTLNIHSTAEIVGDVIFYGGNAEINGPVGGSVFGSAQRLRIDAPIGGSVEVTTANELTLGDKALVAGDVRYQSRLELVRGQGATIEGEVQQQTPPPLSQRETWQSFLIPLLVTLFATLTLYLLFKREMQQVVRTALASPLPAGLIGLATIVTAPLVSVLMISTVLGLLLGVFGLGAVLALVTVGFMLATVLIGTLISKFLTKKTEVSLVSIILGGVTFHALMVVPVFGLLIALALVSMAVGAMVLSLYRHGR